MLSLAPISGRLLAQLVVVALALSGSTSLAFSTPALSAAAAKDMACYFSLERFGVARGYGPGEPIEAAAAAMAYLQTSYLEQAHAEGIGGDALTALEHAAQQQAEAHADNRDADAACVAKGQPALDVLAAHRDFVSAADEKLWCFAMLSFFDKQVMLGGGPSRVEIARRAIGVLSARLEFDRGLRNLSQADYTTILRVYWQRVSVQGFALAATQGNFDVIERDYLPCFDWAERSAALNLFTELNGPVPARVIAGGYPVSDGFVQWVWCGTALRELQKRDLYAKADEERVGRAIFAARKAYLADSEAASIQITQHLLLVGAIDARARTQVEKFAVSGEAGDLQFDPTVCFEVPG